MRWKLSSCVDVASAPDVFHAIQNRMFGILLNAINQCSATFLSVITVVTYPGFSEDLLTKPVFPTLLFALPIIMCKPVTRIFLVMKPVCSGTNAYYWFTTF